MWAVNAIAFIGFLVWSYFHPSDFAYPLIGLVTFNKIDAFAENIGLAVINMNTDQFNLALARDTDPPTASDTIISNITQVSGTGYAAGVGLDSTNVWDQNPAGTGRLRGTSVMWTATAADWVSFQYPILYDSTPATKYLIAYWNYGSAVTLGNGETFSALFSAAAVGVAGAILTLA